MLNVGKIKFIGKYLLFIIESPVDQQKILMWEKSLEFSLNQHLNKIEKKIKSS